MSNTDNYTPPVILPPSTLVMGPAGVGKTTVLQTLMASGISVRMVATEPTAPNRVIQTMKERGTPMSMFDWKFVSPASNSWEDLIESATKVNTLSLKDLSELKGGIAKQNGTQWIEFLRSMNNFVSDKDGKSYGGVQTWGPDVAFVIDGLTGVNHMSRNLTVGLKPNPSPGEWGVMQGNILNVVKKLCSDLRCFFVCIAHIERENNETTGMSNLTVSTLGAKLAPKLPPEFTTVVYAQRVGNKFSWSTATPGVDTKNGDLEISEAITPNFAPIVNAFRERLKTATAPQQAEAPTGKAA